MNLWIILGAIAVVYISLHASVGRIIDGLRELRVEQDAARAILNGIVERQARTEGNAYNVAFNAAAGAIDAASPASKEADARRARYAGL